MLLGRRTALIGNGMAAVLVAGLLVCPTSANAAEAGPEPVAVKPEKSVPGKDFVARGKPADPQASSVLRQPPPSAVWPVARAVEVNPATGGGTGPVSLSAPRDRSARMPAAVRLEMLRHADAEQAGINGLMWTVRRTDAAFVEGVGTVGLTVDYSAFRHAYGGDWATRLKLVSLPACVLATPAVAGCHEGKPLEARHDLKAGRLSADVAVSAETSVLALTAAPAGSAGDFKASPLAASASWAAGDAAGNFTWTYPLQTPPGLNGPEPELELAYSSGGVDGRVASTNNQSSWVGEGWDLTESFIERRYKPCMDDVAFTPKPGDLCWETDNAFLVLQGRATELVKDQASGQWRGRSDNGTRIERLTNAVNGDNDGEHWKVTTVDGTQYFFGLNRLPHWTEGAEVTASAWTVPVFGNDAGEPCHASTFAASSCDQAWRWNLDYAVDPHGNAQSLFYTTEINYYGRNLTASPGARYVRAGQLSRIDYGQVESSLFAAKAPMRVTFTTEERCAAGATCNPNDTITSANAKNWPDVPFDQNCNAGTACTGRYSPTFWTRKRLTAVTTQLLQPASGTYRDVETWTLGYEFREPGDGTSPVLWLASITDTGKVGDTLAAHPVTFQGIQLDNRVDALEGLPAMTKWRITDIYDESGGHLHVNYALVDCARPSLPAVDTNTRRCFPQYWQTDGGSNLNLDWFHKYVPAQVLEGDISGVAEVEETSYEYLDGGAWHYDDNDLTPDRYRTWGQWRGFSRVRVTHGAAGGIRTSTEVLFMRGMHGDRLLTGTRTATVTDSTGTAVTDSDPLAGFGRETITWSSVSGGQTEAVIADPWMSSPTATNGSTKAYMVDVSVERKRVALEGGGWRYTEKRSHFDSYGQLSQVDDLGDTSTPADDQCTRFTYARNTSAWIVDTESRIETVAVPCSATPSYPDDVVSDTRYYYDGSTVLGAAPTYGDATKEEELASFSGTTPVYAQKSRAVYDSHGREVESYDALNAKTTTVYTPAAGGPVTGQTVTNPAGHTVTTTIEPAWGEELVTVDPNGRRTEMTYDPLGRMTAVWLPNRPRASGFTPSERYTYLIRADAPSVVIEETIRDNDTYEPAYTFYDGRLRERQTQTVAPDGGRVVTDTFYDSRGLPAKENLEYWNSGSAGTTILTGVADSAVPGQNVYLYDASERETDEIFRSFGVEKWRTVTTYHGDRISVDPPAGQTPTTQVLDADERVVELRHHAGASPTGAYDATKYSYTKAGHLESVTDAAGNVWRYEYDLRGREVRRTDPDHGATTSTYDNADRLLSTTDARGVTLAYTYDILGRKTGVFEGSPSGTPRAQWRYDTLSTGATVKGQLASATRYVNGNAYTQSVDAYDAMYRPLVTTVTIPAVEGALSGAYRVNTGYTLTGLPATVSYPAAGGLPAETLRYGYDGFGRLQTVQTGLSTLQVSASYTPFGEPLSRTFSATAGRQLVETSFYENGTRRLSRVAVDATPTGHLADANYTYDASGNITRIADTPVDGAADVQCFKYDYLQRLSEAWSATDNCAAAPAASRIGGPAPYWQAWTYDKVGNRLSETNFNPATGARVTSTYAYAAARSARPHAVSSVTTGSRVDTYAYDLTGNTISRNVSGLSQTLTWDAEGELATVTHNGKTSSYLYDADGQRLIRRDPDATTLYLMGTELRLPTSGAVSATRFYPLGGVVAVRTAAGLSFQVADRHGTATISVNAADMSVSRRWYSPFGGPRGNAAGGWPDEHGYVGGVNDTAVGLVRLGAREYDPLTGRFISVDPLIDVNDPQQMNGYAYANNTPIVADDADGEFLKSIVKKIRKAVTKIKRVVHRAVKKVVKKAKKVIKRVKKAIKRAAKAVKKRFASAAKRAKAHKKRVAKAKAAPTTVQRRKGGSSNGCKWSPYATGLGNAFSCLGHKIGGGISSAAVWSCRQFSTASNAGGLGAGLLSMSKKGLLGSLARKAGWTGVAISAIGLGCQVGSWLSD